MQQTDPTTEELEQLRDDAREPERTRLQGRLAWALRSSAAERAARLAEQVLSRFEGEDGDDPRTAEAVGWAALTLATQATSRADYEGSRALAERSLAQFERCGHAAGTAHTLLLITRCNVMRNEIPAAQASAERALRLLQPDSPPAARTSAWNALGNVALAQVDTERAAACFHHALEIAEAAGMRHAEAAACGNLGVIQRHAENWPDAVDYLRRTEELARELGNLDLLCRTQQHLANIYLQLNDLTGAHASARDGVDTALASGGSIATALCRRTLARVQRRLGAIEEATENARKSLDALAVVGPAGAHAEAVHLLGQLRLEAGALDEAESLLDEALEKARVAGDGELAGLIAADRGSLELLRDRPNDAIPWFAQGAASLRGNKREADRVRALIGRGKALTGSGRAEEAVETLEEALGVALALPIPNPVPEVHAALGAAHEVAGRPEQAFRHLQQAQETKEEQNSRRSAHEREHLRVVMEVEHGRREAAIERSKNSELAEANQRLVRLNREKGELLQIVAHDLRSPLTAIEMSADFLGAFGAGLTADEITEHQTQILNAAVRLQNILAPLTDVGAIEGGSLDTTPSRLDLLALIERAAAAERSLAQAKGIRIEIERDGSSPLASANRAAVTKVLENLLSNAIKFSPSGTTIRVCVPAPRTPAGHASFEVRDQGPGIPAEEMGRIFSKFTRLSPRPTGAETSTGLGLYIVKKLVTSVDGTVKCQSRIGEGTCFRVVLPGV